MLYRSSRSQTTFDQTSPAKSGSRLWTALAAVYARVSTGEQNPEAQLLALREYAVRQ
jgi:hypothetical protein